MKKFKIIFTAFTIVICFVFSSCGKGYEVRFTNYNTELLDTVIVGSNEIIFPKIDRQSTTEYKTVKAGDKYIRCITKTKKVYSSKITIPTRGTGKRTIQIDGLNSISILED